MFGVVGSERNCPTLWNTTATTTTILGNSLVSMEDELSSQEFNKTTEIFLLLPKCLTAAKLLHLSSQHHWKTENSQVKHQNSTLLKLLAVPVVFFFSKSFPLHFFCLICYKINCSRWRQSFIKNTAATSQNYGKSHCFQWITIHI